MTARKIEHFKVNYGRTKLYQGSAIPYLQRLLKEHFKEKEKEGEGEGVESRRRDDMI